MLFFSIINIVLMLYRKYISMNKAILVLKKRKSMWPCTKLCKWKHTKGNQFIHLDVWSIIWNCSQSVTDMKNFFLLPVGSLLTWPESLGSTPFLKIRLFMHNYLAPPAAPTALSAVIISLLPQKHKTYTSKTVKSFPLCPWVAESHAVERVWGVYS